MRDGLQNVLGMDKLEIEAERLGNVCGKDIRQWATTRDKKDAYTHLAVRRSRWEVRTISNRLK